MHNEHWLTSTVFSPFGAPWTNVTKGISVADLGFEKGGFIYCAEAHTAVGGSRVSGPCRGVWGAYPPGKFWKYGCSEASFGAFWAMFLCYST